MGFRGYEERLCENGHYDSAAIGQAMSDAPFEGGCRFCGKPFMLTHLVDTTNGYDEKYPSTCDAPKQEIGFDDDWKVDHYGNKYAVKVERYRPIGNHWRADSDSDDN